MQLIATPANPVPRNATLAMIRSVDGLQLRVARWPSRRARSKGTVTICQGRAEFIEKYFEVVEELLARGFGVVAFDWRGQGGSARELDNSRKGYVRKFSYYQRDIAAVGAQVLEPFCPKPWFALGHSMGGAILLEHGRGTSIFERMALSAPMVDIAGISRPRLTRALVSAACLIGLGGRFIPGGGETSYATRPFEKTVLTSDAARYQRTADIIGSGSFLGLGDPTLRWLNSAFVQMQKFANPDYPRTTRTPILIIAAGADEVVDTRAAARFAARLKAGKLLEIPYAKHEILVERDEFRAHFWAAFDAFVPGTRGEIEAGAREPAAKL